METFTLPILQYVWLKNGHKHIVVTTIYFVVENVIIKSILFHKTYQQT